MRISVKSVNSAVLFFVVGLLVAVTAVSCRDALPACPDPLGCITIRRNDSIQIATMLSRTGNTAVIGEDALRGVEMAVAERDGELLNHEIELLSFDSGCNQRLGRRAAETIAENGAVLGIIGPTCSDVARTIIPIVNDAGLILISPSATASNLTDVQPENGENRHTFWRTVPNNLAQAEVAAMYAYQVLGKRTAVTIHDGTSYARELQQTFSQTFQRLGGTVQFQGSVVVGETAVQDILTELIVEEPEVFYLPVFAPEANLIAVRLLEMNETEDITLIGADSLLTPEFAMSVESAAENMLVSGTAVHGIRYEALLQEWSTQYNEEPMSVYHAHAYDATKILMDVISEVAIQQGDSLLIGRQALREAMDNIDNYPGVTGSITCQSAGDCAAAASVGIYQFSNDEISGANWPPEVVWTP